MSLDWLTGLGDWFEDNKGFVGNTVQLVSAYLMADGTMEAAEATNEARLRLSEMSNEQAEYLYRLTRGAEGHAILPEYFEGLEEEIANDIADTYRNTEYNTEIGDATFEDMQDVFGLGNQFVRDIYTGELAADRRALLEEEYANLIGAQDARVGVARGRLNDNFDRATNDIALGYGQAEGILDDYESRANDNISRMEAINKDASTARRAAINTSLGDRLKQLQHARMRKGLGGSSSFANNQLAGSTIGARQAAAMGDIDDRRALVQESNRVNELFAPQRTGLATRRGELTGSINSQRAGSVLSLDSAANDAFNRTGAGFVGDNVATFDNNQRMQQGYLDAPIARTQNAYTFGYLPTDQKWKPFDAARQRLDWFNIGPGNAPNIVTPHLETVPTSKMVIGAGGSVLGDILTDRPGD